MRIAIMGSGGVGGFFGAQLARGGADVNFVARGAHLAAMREHGLAIESTDESSILPKVKVTDDPATIGPVDLVMFGVKLWDTEQAARSLLPIIGRETALISFQNGVQKDDMLRPIFGESAIMGGVAYVGTNISRPGVIAQNGPMQRLVFGEYDGRRSRARRRVPCGLPARRHQRRAQRRRAPRDLGEVRGAGRMAGATASMRKSLGPVRSQSADAAIPARSGARGRGGWPRARRGDPGQISPSSGCRSSIRCPPTCRLRCITTCEPGRPLELQWLSGGVVDLGAKVGVPTPMNRAVRDILMLHAAGRPDSKPAWSA